MAFERAKVMDSWLKVTLGHKFQIQALTFALFTALYFVIFLFDHWTGKGNRKRSGYQHKMEDLTGKGVGGGARRGLGTEKIIYCLLLHRRLTVFVYLQEDVMCNPIISCLACCHKHSVVCVLAERSVETNLYFLFLCTTLCTSEDGRWR